MHNTTEVMLCLRMNGDAGALDEVAETVIKLIPKAVKDISIDPALFLFVATKGTVGYSRDLGCPTSGEPCLILTAVRNAENPEGFGVETLYVQIWKYLVSLLKQHYSQLTATLVVREVTVDYL